MDSTDGLFGLSWNEIAKDSVTAVAGVAGGAIGSVICPGAGTMIGGALAAGLVGGIWTGAQTQNLETGIEAGLVDGALGAIGGGLVGGAARGIVQTSGSLASRAAFGAGLSLAEKLPASYLLGSGIGTAVVSHFTPQNPPTLAELPTRLIGIDPTT
ncbi:hypothetical protein ACQP1G_19850 [Nocardia sp. CA-107356]|uniref:hypothetical protein n=1 Tax=Nocardia sp. CA-107356 TaxID=3239972 RepID=UPI003D943DE3